MRGQRSFSRALHNGHVDEERKRLRLSFDGDPLTYDLARPGYPDQLYDDIVFACSLEKQSRLLEIGCGTGKATMAFARRGYSIDAVEIGERMAKFAVEKAAGYDVNVMNTSFEEWQTTDNHYDLAFAATSFHWIDSRTSLAKVNRALKEGGHIAVFWHSHVMTERTADAFDSLQRAYEEEAPAIAHETFRKQVENSSMEFHDKLQKSGLFGEIRRGSYYFTESYDANAYVRLLSTYSDHITLDEETRSNLFTEIRKLIGKMPGGSITKEYETVLFTARKTGKV